MSEIPLSAVNQELLDRGLDLGGAFIEMVRVWQTEENIDARVVAIGAATVAGCFINGISDNDLRSRLCRHFAQTFFETAGVPLRVEGQQ